LFTNNNIVVVYPEQEINYKDAMNVQVWAMRNWELVSKQYAVAAAVLQLNYLLRVNQDSSGIQ
jgi:hypothetical protein